MKNQKVVEGLKKQHLFEIESAYVYLGMAAYCKGRGYDGFARFMTLQAQEELEHAQKFFDFLYEIEEEVELNELPAVTKEYESILDVFSTALEHEREVTKRIHDIYADALESKDYAAKDFLDWFIAEQREEEDTFLGIIDKLEKFNEVPTTLYLYDKELGRRQE
ncbi:MAG: ferritin [Tissierellia bacterium]|nr:ferritin [Tissierellia bacterium]